MNPPTMSPRRWLALLVALLLAVAACGGDDDETEAADDTTTTEATDDTADDPDDTDTTEPTEDDLGLEDLPPEEELAPALLTTEDVGEGWVELPEDEDDDDPLCGLKLTEVLDLPEDSLPNAEVQLAQDADTGPLLAEALGFVPEGRGEETVEGVREILAACDGSQTAGLDATVVELDVEQLGDESAAYQVGLSDPDNPSQTAEFFIAFVRDGDLLITLGAFDLAGGTGEALIDEWLPVAYEKAAETLL